MSPKVTNSKLHETAKEEGIMYYSTGNQQINASIWDAPSVTLVLTGDDSPEEIPTIGLGDLSGHDLLEAPSEEIFEDNEHNQRRKNSNLQQVSSFAAVPELIPEIMMRGRWSERFTELEAFKKLTGHCNVPYSYKQNLALARWVKRQRYQYKLMLSGKASTMTLKRAEKLASIGFVFRYHATAWDENFNELSKFHATHGHCNVPRMYSSRNRLHSWVKSQRRLYKAFSKGQLSGKVFSSRFHALNQLGFKWEPMKK